MTRGKVTRKSIIRKSKKQHRSLSPQVDDSTVQRAIYRPNLQTLKPQVVQRLQETHGNQFVLNLLNRSVIQREGNSKGTVHIQKHYFYVDTDGTIRVTGSGHSKSIKIAAGTIPIEALTDVEVSRNYQDVLVTTEFKNGELILSGFDSFKQEDAIMIRATYDTAKVIPPDDTSVDNTTNPADGDAPANTNDGSSNNTPDASVVDSNAPAVDDNQSDAQTDDANVQDDAKNDAEEALKKASIDDLKEKLTNWLDKQDGSFIHATNLGTMKNVATKTINDLPDNNKTWQLLFDLNVEVINLDKTKLKSTEKIKKLDDKYGKLNP